MRALKTSFARLAGCDADELAITTNISIAISTIASALEFGDRNKVVMSELDFPTDGHVWLANAKRGVEIEWLRSPDGLTIPLEEYDRAIDERTAVVMVNRVLYRSSAIVDAKEVCRIARERGALSFLDDYHGIGIVPLDLHDVGCDVYAAGVLKWLCGGPGLAFLYVRRALIPSLEPAVTGWFGTAEPFSFDTQHLEYHPTARRFEHGTPPAPVFFIAQGGLDIIGDVTPERIRARQGELGDHVIARADELGLPVRTPRDRNARGGVVNVGVGPEAGKICHALLERDVCTTTAATAFGSARTSSTPRRTSTAASTSCGQCSDRRYTRGRTSTETRCTALFENPPRFHDGSSGCSLPAPSAARQQSSTVPGCASQSNDQERTHGGRVPAAVLMSGRPLTSPSIGTTGPGTSARTCGPASECGSASGSRDARRDHERPRVHTRHRHPLVLGLAVR
jgi:selenocysteine lyase/cysteine desulfurase